MSTDREATRCHRHLLSDHFLFFSSLFSCLYKLVASPSPSGVFLAASTCLPSISRYQGIRVWCAQCMMTSMLWTKGDKPTSVDLRAGGIFQAPGHYGLVQSCAGGDHTLCMAYISAATLGKYSDMPHSNTKKLLKSAPTQGRGPAFIAIFSLQSPSSPTHLPPVQRPPPCPTEAHGRFSEYKVEDTGGYNNSSCQRGVD